MRGADGRLNRAYSGVPTFLRSDYCDDISTLDADYAVLGVPYDDGSPFVGGSRFCARAVREHSLRFGGGALYDIAEDKEYLREALANRRIVDCGDVDVAPSRGDITMANLTNDVIAIRERGAMPIVLGGDHTLTYPVVRAFDEPMHVIQLDAHLDYTPDDQGLTYTNSTSMRLIHQMEHVTSLTQFGIRSMRDTKQNADDARANGGRIVTMPEIRKQGGACIADHLPAGDDCYVTIDIDAYDMSLCPGCISAEPGGLTYEEMQEALKAITSTVNVVGFDFVEVNPPLDVGTGVTSYLGALTVAMFLGYIDEARRR
ncbi:MAG: arginase [Alphaproteobacteria bacterium]|nr:arginase [Alphaproteobacteria bacterium]